MGGIGGGREVQEEGLIHIQKTDSLHCTTEANTHCKVTTPQLKKKKEVLRDTGAVEKIVLCMINQGLIICQNILTSQRA